MEKGDNNSISVKKNSSPELVAGISKCTAGLGIVAEIWQLMEEHDKLKAV